MEIFLPNPSDIDIAPDKVWRDDIFTYIDLGPKALTMTQRPVVSLIVQDSEVPVGFRTRGPNSRLIVVEAVGDLVLRNGKKIICLKLRRDPASGLEYTDYSGDQARTWYAPSVPGPDGRPNTTTAAGMDLSSDSKQAALSMDGKTVLRQSDLDQILAAAGQSNVSINQTSAQNTNVNTAYHSVAGETQGVMQPIPADVRNSAAASSGIVGVMQQVQGNTNGGAGTSNSGMNGAGGMYGTGGVVGQGLMGATESISVELGSHADIATLETMWEGLVSQNEDVLKGYEPYYSVDTTADGDVKELFRLRIGPMKNVQAGDNLCRKLGRRGHSCTVIRVQ